MTIPTVTVPVEPEYTATDYLRLIAEGWEVIESTGSQMTIQNPEDDGPQDLVIDVDALTAAPVREEGGAVETAVKIATDLHHAYEQLIYGLPKYLEAENLTDEENMIREAWITLDVTAHRLAALATREEAPAEAGAVTHSEACHYADTSGDPLISMARTAWQRLEGEQPDVHAASVTLHGLMLALAYEALRAQPQAREEAQPVHALEIVRDPTVEGAKRFVGITTPPAPEAEKLRILDVVGDYLIQQYGKSYGLHHPIDRARILAALQQEVRPDA